MKNLNLRNLNLSEGDKLQREQLKFILGSGGYGFSSCSAVCSAEETITCEGTYSCEAKDYKWCNGDDGSDFKECIYV